MSMPVCPALPGLEVVEAPHRHEKNRRPDVNGRERTPLPARGELTTVAGDSLQHETSSRIARLNELTAQQLRDDWRRLHGGQPPRLSRDLLTRTIAYRIQEIAYGGLNKAIQRKLAVLSNELKLKGSVVITPDVSLRPGARLVREWRGRTHTVIVTENGFEYAGEVFLSLTKIAHAITGAHWSGPRFFGLNRKRASNDQSQSDAAGTHAGDRIANG
jgi:hypothetical protein